MKVTKLSFEGDSKEFAIVRNLFADTGASQEVVPTVGQSEEDEEWMVRMMERVLTRVELADNHKSMLKAIVAAGDDGILKSDLVSAIGIKDEQFKGVIGSFGRRVANTPDWPASTPFYDAVWDNEAGEWRYWLDDPYRSAVSAKL